MSRDRNSLLANRNFILLLCAYGISAFGDHLSELGIMKEMGIERNDEKTRIQALMLFFFFLPYVLLGPVAGAVADRLPRRMIMIGADLVRAVISFSIPWYITTLDDPSSKWMLLPILGLGLFACFFNPARLAFVPQVVEDRYLTQANSLLGGLAPIAAICSSVVGGWLVDRGGPQAQAWINAAFYCDAATFAVSGMLVACIGLPWRDHPAKVGPGGSDGPHRSVFQDVLVGVRYIRQHRLVWQLMIFTATFWMAAGIFSSVVPAVVFDWYRLGIQELGYMRATLGLGMLVGALVLTLIGDASRPHYNVVVALLGTGVSLLLFARTSSAWFGGALGVMVGVFGVWIIISATTLIQRVVPNFARGKVFGIIDLVNMSGMLLATGLLGILDIPGLDQQIGWVLCGLAVGLIVLGVLLWRHHYLRARLPLVLRVCCCINEVLCKFWYRLHRDGVSTIPASGACIITANHTCSADPCFMIASSPRRTFGFMVAREYYNLPVWNHLIRALECIPVRRDGRDIAATKEALRNLKNGKALGIFIEGRIPQPGEPTQLHDGAAALALLSGATVIPLHISGVRYSDSVLGTFFLHHRVRLRFGKPVDLSAFTDPRDREQVSAATTRIWEAIQSLAPADGRVYLNL